MQALFSISVVLYENDPKELKELISGVLASGIPVTLFLIDNSLNDDLRACVKADEIVYVFNGANIGYGSGHNLAIKMSQDQGLKYHLVMNPDISFGLDVLSHIYHYMEANPDVAQLMPKILYNEGEVQPLCKLLPTPFDLIGRRFFKNAEWAVRRNKKYELDGFGYDKIVNTPSLSGCFMFLRNEVLKEVGGFDQRYFMYLEDYDLTRRLHKRGKTIFYPGVVVYHGYKKESYTNKTLLKHHINSAIKYFNKWGWILDKERDEFNRSTLNQIFKG